MNLEARLHNIGAELPCAVLDDGRSIPVDYEALDGSGARHGDRVRVEVSAAGTVTRMRPLLSVSAAVAVLTSAGILDELEDAAALGGDDQQPWPSALFDHAWDSSRETVFRCDQHYLEADDVKDWLHRSGLSSATVEPGPEEGDEPTLMLDAGQGPHEPVGATEFDVYWAVAGLLRAADARFRWYQLTSDDARFVCLRLDRETAKALGVGVFDDA